jgi:hypothetical protein
MAANRGTGLTQVGVPTLEGVARGRTAAHHHFRRGSKKIEAPSARNSLRRSNVCTFLLTIVMGRPPWSQPFRASLDKSSFDELGCSKVNSARACRMVACIHAAGKTTSGGRTGARKVQTQACRSVFGWRLPGGSVSLPKLRCRVEWRRSLFGCHRARL